MKLGSKTNICYRDQRPVMFVVLDQVGNWPLAYKVYAG